MHFQTLENLLNKNICITSIINLQLCLFFIFFYKDIEEFRILWIQYTISTNNFILTFITELILAQ